jgi:hypothetical protein
LNHLMLYFSSLLPASSPVNSMGALHSSSFLAEVSFTVAPCLTLHHLAATSLGGSGLALAGHCIGPTPLLVFSLSKHRMQHHKLCRPYYGI